VARRRWDRIEQQRRASRKTNPELAKPISPRPSGGSATRGYVGGTPHVPPTVEESAARRHYEEVYARAFALLDARGWYHHYREPSTWYPPEDPAWWQVWRRRTFSTSEALREIGENAAAAEIGQASAELNYHP
jgi:hypothetical protein